jgi:Sortilin, neurotensin receptor 3,
VVQKKKAYTILESSTDSVFLHMTTSESPRPYWGDLLKSNWNGTYFGTSIMNVNRDERGYVDFEKMIGLDGIALINVVSNPDMAAVTGAKDLQTRITHNDGGSWKQLNPPKYDSHGQPYGCQSAVRASLRFRRDPVVTIEIGLLASRPRIYGTSGSSRDV